MDLSQLKVSEEPVKMELRHPSENTTLKDDQGNPITISLIGMDSPQYKAVDAKIRNRYLKNQRLTRNKLSVTAEEIDEDTIERVCACIVGWEGVVLDGEPLTYSKDNTKKLLTYPGLSWITEQIMEFVSERENFMKTSSRS